MTTTLEIGFLIYPDVTQLDATGPAQVLSSIPGARTHWIWKTPDPVPTDAGFSILPTHTYETCPRLDVLCVPGGGGQIELMGDEATLSFLRKQAETARYVTSVCTGSLLLGAAGLLRGKKASCHWAWHDMLSTLGALPVKARVVRDGNYFTGGGVTAGIDFALTLAAELAGEETAKLIQLMLEYDPKPPFDCGTPEAAGPQRADRVRKLWAASIESRRERIEALGQGSSGS